MITLVEEGARRLVDGLKRAGIELNAGPASPEELAAVARELPLSPELSEWYSKVAPMEEVSFDWGAYEFFLHDLPGLVEWQDGWRWSVGKRGQIDPAWKPEWVVIANWDGDPAIALTNQPGTPVARAPHGEGDWNPTPIAPSLGAFLAAVGIWVEIVHGKYQGDIEDEEYEMRKDVRKELETALGPILEKKYLRPWTRFED